MSKLVSVITPCYNGEKFVSRLLDSVLEQTYPNIEFIFVDDGSTDKTKDIVESYIPLYKNRGFNLIYLYQENQGQAEAINKGLELYTGYFLTWPDSDDFYTEKTSIEQMVNVLENSDTDVSSVRCQANVLEECTLKFIKRYETKKYISKSNLFKDCLFECNFWFTPGCYIVKADILRKVLNNKRIFVSRGGQNWQLFLPLFYKYDCVYINKPLFNYLIRLDSHSRGLNKGVLLELFSRMDLHQEILIETIQSMEDMPDTEKEKNIYLIRHKYIKRKFEASVQHGNKEQSHFYFNELEVKYKRLLTWDSRLMYQIRGSSLLLKILNKAITIIRK